MALIKTMKFPGDIEAREIYDTRAHEALKEKISYLAQELTDEQKEQARTNIGAGVPQVQTNMAQNDDTQPDYVQNRTHWSEMQSAEIFSVIDCVLTEMDGMYAAYLHDKIHLEVGKKYAVNWNGVNYECVAQDLAGETIAIGNLGVMGFGSVTDDPFIIVAFADELIEDGDIASMLMALDESTQVTTSICDVVETIHTLDIKYIEDMYGKAYSTAECLLPETTFEGRQLNLDSSLNMLPGQTYTVIWNGIPYDCEVTSQRDAQMAWYILGEYYGMGNNEPFAVVRLVTADQEVNTIISNDGTTSNTISISRGYTLKTIDKKYLPNHIANHNFVNGSSEGSVRAISALEDNDTYTIGGNAFAHGLETRASGECSHAEGNGTTASGGSSHAEGVNTIASAPYSHAEGFTTSASGTASHTEGANTIATSDFQHVQGKYNIEDIDKKYAHIVGNGGDNVSRSNAHTVSWDGVGWFAKDLRVGGNGQYDGAKKVMLDEPQNYIVLNDAENGLRYVVEMRGGNLVSSPMCHGIKIITPPDNIECNEGFIPDVTGMVVEASYEDGSTKIVEDYTYSYVKKDGVFTISYTHGCYTFTDSIICNVIPMSEILIDFNYTENNDGTYTLTGWKGTLNGEESTEIVIPDNYLIVL